MPRLMSSLHGGCPVVQIELADPAGGTLPRILLADTGAGTRSSPFQLILSENDCRRCGGKPGEGIVLGGAYVGEFPSYAVRVQIPVLAFNQYVVALAVPSVPSGFDGIACFRFLNRFTYGNFGVSAEFGLECES